MVVHTPDLDDPFCTLEAAAKKQAAAEKVHERISQARTRLVLSKKSDWAFYANLALRLKVEVDDTLGTMATDGRRLVVDPEFVAGISEDERIGVVAHEVMHCAHNHMARLDQRNKQLFNIAADLVVNPIVLASGLKLPSGRLMPGEGDYKDIPAGLSTEETYAKLRDRPKQPNDNGDEEVEGDGPADPGGCGGVIPPPGDDPAAERQLEGEWKVAVAQAANMAKQRGPLSEGLARLVVEILEPVVDWRSVLREFVTRMAKSDYSWTPPNRRYVHQNLYLPSIRSEELGEVVLALDTSGSIDNATLSRFASEIQGILEAFPDASLHIIYHHAAVYNVQQWAGSDGPIELEQTESGGTSHVPVFQKIEELGLDPTCLVCLTDLETSFPDEAPHYPTLWAVVGSKDDAPFGQVVEVK
jgi:predicted metal-dependent peptidase